MTPSTRDRIMSLHRRAYACESLEAWEDLAQRLDCPPEAVTQFWRTARAAKEAGMSKEQAFPLSGEVFKEVSTDCLPGDLVWWRSLSGEVCEGTFREMDNGTALIENGEGQHAVRCV